MTSFRKISTFRNLGAFLSFVTVAGVSSYVAFSGKLVVTGVNSVLSQSCDLLHYGQLAGGSSNGALGILYPRTVSAIGYFYPGLSTDLAIAASISVALILAGAFLVASILLRDTRAGLLASIVSVFLISATGVLQFSEYAFLEGLAFVLLASAFLFGYSDWRKPWLLPPAALLGLLASLSDPYWGIILFAAAAGTTLLSLVAQVPLFRAPWITVATIPPLAASAYSLLVFHPAPATLFQWNWALMSILALTALWGGAALVLTRSMSSIALLVPLVFVSMIVAPFSSLQYSILPLALLALMSLASVGSKMLSVQRRYSPNAARPAGREVFDIDIDLARLPSAVVVIALVLSSGFFGTFAIAGGLQQQRVESNSYGPSQINPALDWIRNNTGSASVFAAPETFSNWVQTYTGRQTILGPPACPSPSYSNSLQAQANDLILNSNVELRNEYLSLTDGSPYRTTQTPMFSVSNGSSFADLIYATDVYNRVGFSYAGSNWVEAPYQPKNFSSEWVARNSTEASLKMTFTTESLRFEKTMTLFEGSREATVTYAISPLKPVQLHSMNVTFWTPTNESIGNLTRIGDTLQLHINDQLVLVASTPSPTNSSLTVVGGQERILLQYRIMGGSFSVSLRIGFPSALKSAWSTGVFGVTSDEIIKQYDVSYLAVQNQPHFSERLGSDPRFKQAYTNSNLIIFQVRR